MIKQDKELRWRPGRVYVPVGQFSGLAYEATGAAGIKSVGAGTPSATNLALTEIGTTGLVGLVMEAAGNSVMHSMLLPYDYDTLMPMYLRVHWSSQSLTTADTIGWLVQYTPITLGVTAIIDPATALTTVIPQDTVSVAVANTWEATGWGKIGANVIGQRVEAITFEVEMDAFAAGLTEVKHLLGLELRYTPRRLAGPDGMFAEAKGTNFMLGKSY